MGRSQLVPLYHAKTIQHISAHNFDMSICCQTRMLLKLKHLSIIYADFIELSFEQSAWYVNDQYMVMAREREKKKQKTINQYKSHKYGLSTHYKISIPMISYRYYTYSAHLSLGSLPLSQIPREIGQ